MSDTTLYSSIYQQLNSHAELVDEVLISIVTNQHDSKLFTKLSKQLKEIVEPSEGQLSNRLIGQMLLEDSELGRSDIEMIINALDSNTIDDLTRQRIEKLAQALEQERMKAMARIRGDRR